MAKIYSVSIVKDGTKYECDEVFKKKTRIVKHVANFFETKRKHIVLVNRGLSCYWEMYLDTSGKLTYIGEIELSYTIKDRTHISHWAEVK